ncbi:MAG: helix-turn-helix transcriptional regulator, partial [Thermoanaerobaculia bacterium]
MLGDTVREARIRKNLTQARLAKLAGVSRRHLAALEKGANVSINILQRVASVLELTEIQIGELSLRSGNHDKSVNVPLLTDTIREARAEAERAQALLARAENLLGSEGLPIAAGGPSMHFPRMPVRRLATPRMTAADTISDAPPDYVELTTAGEIRHAEPVNEENKETVSIPKSLVESGEIVFR